MPCSSPDPTLLPRTLPSHPHCLTGMHSEGSPLPPGGVAACGWGLPEPPSTQPGSGGVFCSTVAAAPLQAPSCGICQGQIATPEPAGSAPWPLSPHYFCVPGLRRHLPPSSASRLLPASPTPLQGGPAVWGLLFSSFFHAQARQEGRCWPELLGLEQQTRQVPPSWLGQVLG